ncbi:DUF2149 domain-containing protein [Xanthomonas massiliensis]|uniref:DUF2149 domain-containing protein n=1 Tax=Xanthomonas massiliensis TaxID=1720302 RepID=UPI00098EFB46|nr:DUF2149 domain-containing protein [Xanthomonas massiliensis]
MSVVAAPSVKVAGRRTATGTRHRRSGFCRACSTSRRRNIPVIGNPGEAGMRITVKHGEELTRYESTGQIGEGGGVKAGVTYRLPDGRMVYVPEGAAPAP